MLSDSSSDYSSSESSSSESSSSSISITDSLELNRKIVLMREAVRAKREYEFQPRLVNEMFENIRESALIRQFQVPRPISQMIAEMSCYEHDFVFTFRCVDLMKLFCEHTSLFSNAIRQSDTSNSEILSLCAMILYFEPWMLSWDSSVRSWRQSCVCCCDFSCDNRVASYHEYNLDDIVPVLSTPISLSRSLPAKGIDDIPSLDLKFFQRISRDFDEPKKPERNPFSMSSVLRLLLDQSAKVPCHHHSRFWYNKVHVRSKRDEVWIGVTWSKDFRSECRGYYTGELDCMVSYYGGRLSRTRALIRSMNAKTLSRNRKRYSGDRSSLIRQLTEERRSPLMSESKDIKSRLVSLDDKSMTKQDWREQHGRSLSHRESESTQMRDMQAFELADIIREVHMAQQRLLGESTASESASMEGEWQSEDDDDDHSDPALHSVHNGKEEATIEGYCGNLNCGCGGIQTNSQVISACLEPYGTDDCISVLFDRQTSHLSFWKNERFQITVPLNEIPSFVRNKTNQMCLFTALDALGDCHVLEPLAW